MKAEVKSLRPLDATDLQAAASSTRMHWFGTEIGPIGDPASDYFQFAVTTREGIGQRVDKQHPFKGFVIDPFDKTQVRPVLDAFVQAISGSSWDEVLTQLRAHLMWERE